MPTINFTDAPDRFSLANELHARPFPVLSGEGHALSIALRVADPTSETRAEERAHLIALLDRYGAPHPPEHANHYWGQIGRGKIKWERHTEFVTYAIFIPDATGKPFELEDEILPSDWCKSAPGQVETASMIYHCVPKDHDTAMAMVKSHFDPESLAISHVLDNDAIVASDFRINSDGFVRFMLFADEKTGARRIGRISQRLFEIETYKSMSLLSLPAARKVSAELAAIGPKLSEIINSFANETGSHEENLKELLRIAAELEDMTAQNASRFSAAEAYSAIVNERLAVLRESRLGGRQTLSEFMTRRYEPAIRTCAATSQRLTSMTRQAARAGDMLRTRTDVERAEQNQEILSRMDVRADQQLKLQKTVEGLSVVAVSYYAVNLCAYLLAPFSEAFGLSKTSLTALLTVPVVLFVWAMMRNIKRHL